MRRMLVPLGLAVGACTTVVTNVSIVDTPAGVRKIDRRVPGSLSYSVESRVADTTVVVTVSRRERCERGEVPRVSRSRVTERHASEHSTLYLEYLGALAGFVAGAAMVGNPAHACDDPMNLETNESRASECSTAGWIALGASAGVLVAAVVDTARLADDTQDLGIVDGTFEGVTVSCHVRPLAAASVELSLGQDALVLRGVTSAAGEVRFAMRNVGADALPGPDVPAVLRVARKSLPFSIVEEDAAALRGALEADAGSRVAEDATALERARCDIALAGAGGGALAPDAGDDEVASARARWEQARVTCDPRWTPLQKGLYTAAIAAIASNRIGALEAALLSSDQEHVTTLLEDRELVERARAVPEIRVMLRKRIAETLRSQVGKRSEPTGLHDLCVARRAFIAIYGVGDWSHVRAEIALNVSDLSDIPPPALERIMDAASC